jgi:hypothetical protein
MKLVLVKILRKFACHILRPSVAYLHHEKHYRPRFSNLAVMSGTHWGSSLAAVSLAVGYRRSDVGLRLSDLAPAAGLAEGAFDEVRWAAVPYVSKHAPQGAALPAAR